MNRFATIVENAREKFKQWLMPGVATLLLLCLFFVAGGGVSQNDRWRIDTINIVGAKTVSVDAIRALVKEKLAGDYFFVYARENIYLYPRQEIETYLIQTFPRLADVKVSRDDVHTIIVNVSERKPYALWCGMNAENRGLNADSRGTRGELADCWFIDNTGFVFDRAPQFSRGVYLEVYGALVEALVEKNDGDPLRGALPYERFATVDSFVKLLRGEISEPLSVVLKPEGEYEVALQGSTKYPFLVGVTIMAKDESAPEVLVKNLVAAIPVQFPNNVALKKKLLYIDMRFGNKIFFGFE